MLAFTLGNSLARRLIPRLLAMLRFNQVQRHDGGFSLIEVVVAVAVIAILASVAFPSYQAYKVRANRAAAQALLMDLANREQQYFLDTKSYSNSRSTLGYPDAAIPKEVSAFYTIDDPTVNNGATPPEFYVTASPISGTMQANDGQLKLTSAGAKTRGTATW